MCFCGFCGKGPFTSSSGLNRHIGRSLNCNNAQRQEWGTYATNMWDNAPGLDETQQVASPPILDNELADLPDTTLEDHLQEVEYLPDAEPHPEVPPHVPECHRSTVNDAEDEELDTENYIQDSPTNLGAGAVWGEDIPFFEKLRQEQIQNESSRWGPFEDQDEWELAQWLIRNTGHNQINDFLNLNIVSSPCFSFSNLRDHGLH